MFLAMSLGEKNAGSAWYSTRSGRQLYLLGAINQRARVARCDVRFGSFSEVAVGPRDVRCSPRSRHRPVRPTGPFSAMCGRLRVGKSFFHVLQHWSVQPCVRPFHAAHMTAGHNALRGSGPDQNLAFDNAMARVGCGFQAISLRKLTGKLFLVTGKFPARTGKFAWFRTVE